MVGLVNHSFVAQGGIWWFLDADIRGYSLKILQATRIKQAILTKLAEAGKRYGTASPFFRGAFLYMGELQ